MIVHFDGTSIHSLYNIYGASCLLSLEQLMQFYPMLYTELLLYFHDSNTSL